MVTVFLLAAGAGPAPAADPILLGEIDSRTTSSPSTGVDLTLLAITLDVRGGVGRVGGLLAAGLALGLVEGLTLATVGSGSRAGIALTLLGALLVRSRGLGAGHLPA